MNSIFRQFSVKMLLRKMKIKTTMQKLMRKLTSRMILKGKLHDSTHSTNNVFTPFRLRTNFHTEPNRILHWDQHKSLIFLCLRNNFPNTWWHQTCFSLHQASFRHWIIKSGDHFLNYKTKSPRSRGKWHISPMNCHQPRDQLVKSIS